jgi:hypothetical protein
VDGSFLVAALHSLKTQNALREQLRRLTDDESAIAVTTEEVVEELNKMRKFMPQNDDIREAFFVATKLGKVRLLTSEEEVRVQEAEDTSGGHDDFVGTDQARDGEVAHQQNADGQCVVASQSEPNSKEQKKKKKIESAIESENSAEAVLHKILLRGTNVDHFILASQVPSLRSAARKIPGVPIMYVDHGVIHLESPSEASVNLARKIDLERIGIEFKEEAKQERAVANADGKPGGKSRKRSRVNPLSHLPSKEQRLRNKELRSKKNAERQKLRKLRKVHAGTDPLQKGDQETRVVESSSPPPEKRSRTE